MTIIDDTVIGWDVGGANIKAVRLECRDRKIKAFRAAIRPFEIWQNRDSLPMVLRDIGEELGLEDHQSLAVTMTAELSDVFRVKRDGVCYVLNAFEQTFEKSPVYPFSLDGRFLSRDEARQSPLLCAATNWLTSALFIAAHHPDCILMDIGSTTTDIIPIRGGRTNCRGRTDTQRLACGRIGLYRHFAYKPEYCGESSPCSRPALPRCSRVFYLHGGYLSSFRSNSP